MPAETEDDNPPRAAASVILLRRDGDSVSVLMGQRGAAAVFMPSKYVFPGGGLDQDDGADGLAEGLGAVCAGRIGALAQPLAAAALRELWEETGLAIGCAGAGAAEGPWAGYGGGGFVPTAGALRYFFRAITPPGRTRRFDARFFVADAARLTGDPDDFSRASDELSHLHWVPLAEARRLNLPFITEVVLAEVAHYLAPLTPGAPLPAPDSVPFFDNSGPVPTFRRVY